MKDSGNVVDMVQRIAAATGEQSATSEEITKNMNTISEVGSFFGSDQPDSAGRPRSRTARHADPGHDVLVQDEWRSGKKRLS